jgi:hypothetical protein
LNDALNVCTSTSFKLKEEMNCLLILDVSIDDDLGFDIELGSLARNTKKRVCGVIDSFFLFFDKI